MLQIPYYKLCYGVIQIVQQKVNMWGFFVLFIYLFLMPGLY